jgi:hypothetical protein
MMFRDQKQDGWSSPQRIPPDFSPAFRMWQGNGGKGIKAKNRPIFRLFLPIPLPPFLCQPPREVGDVLECGDGAAADSPLSERAGRWVGWTNASPAGESGRGLAPTTALQDAGARFVNPRAKLATLWSAAMERQQIRRFGFGAFKPA